MQELHATALEIRILVAVAAKIGGRSLEQRLQAQGIPISGMQYGMLRLLSHQQYTISELSRRMLLAPATLVPAVDGLERQGFLTRGHDPSDRRRTPLALTDRGGEVLARVPAVHADDALVGGLAAMGAEKRLQLLELLRELLSAMPESRDAAGEIARSILLMDDQSATSDPT